MKDPKEEEDKLHRICNSMVSEKALRRHKPKVAKYAQHVEELMAKYEELESQQKTDLMRSLFAQLIASKH